MVRTASPVREAYLYPPHLPSHKHRPIVENGAFSAGPLVRNRREPRSGRPCEAPPTQDICLRGVRGPARRMEFSPAPGSLWFLSPAGKELARPQTCETPSSRIINPRPCASCPAYPAPQKTPSSYTSSPASSVFFSHATSSSICRTSSLNVSVSKWQSCVRLRIVSGNPIRCK